MRFKLRTTHYELSGPNMLGFWQLFQSQHETITRRTFANVQSDSDVISFALNYMYARGSVAASYKFTLSKDENDNAGQR